MILWISDQKRKTNHLKGLTIFCLYILIEKSHQGAIPNTNEWECSPDDTVIPDPKDCSKFYFCVFGKLKSRTCPQHTHFNPDYLVCDWPQNVRCAQGVIRVSKEQMEELSRLGYPTSQVTEEDYNTIQGINNSEYGPTSGSYGQNVGHSGPTASFRGQTGPSGPSVSYGQNVGPSGPTASFDGQIGPSGPSVSYGQNSGPSGPTALFDGQIGPSGPSVSYGQNVGSSGPTASFRGQTGPSGLSGSYGQNLGPSGPSVSHGQNLGPGGPSVSYGQNVGSSSPTASFRGQTGPSGLSGSYGQNAGPSGPSVSHGQNLGPSGPSVSHGQNAGPSGPSASYGQNLGPGGPSVSYGQNLGPGGPSVSNGQNARPGGPSVSYGQNLGPGVPSVSHGQNAGPSGPSVSYGQNLGPSGPSVSYGQNLGPGGPSVSYGQNLGPGGPSVSYGQNAGPSGPSVLYGQNAGPSGPSVSYGQNLGPGGPSVSYRQNARPGGPSVSYGQQLGTYSPTDSLMGQTGPGGLPFNGTKGPNGSAVLYGNQAYTPNNGLNNSSPYYTRNQGHQSGQNIPPPNLNVYEQSHGYKTPVISSPGASGMIGQSLTPPDYPSFPYSGSSGLYSGSYPTGQTGFDDLGSSSSPQSYYEYQQKGGNNGYVYQDQRTGYKGHCTDEMQQNPNNIAYQPPLPSYNKNYYPQSTPKTTISSPVYYNTQLPNEFSSTTYSPGINTPSNFTASEKDGNNNTEHKCICPETRK